LSVIAWTAFIVCAAAVLIHYLEVRDARFLIIAIPGLIALLVIPMILAWMSRRTLDQAAEEHQEKARPYKIVKISLSTTGQAVRITGEVQKVSFKWLNRPHFQVKDGTGTIRVIMFAAPSEDIKLGDTVDILGVVIKNLFDRRNAAISAVSIKKQKDKTT
jgi:DNA/RNA endonuclease YhcR with UshA esterase domain